MTATKRVEVVSTFTTFNPQHVNWSGEGSQQSVVLGAPPKIFFNFWFKIDHFCCIQAKMGASPSAPPLKYATGWLKTGAGQKDLIKTTNDDGQYRARQSQSLMDSGRVCCLPLKLEQAQCIPV